MKATLPARLGMKQEHPGRLPLLGHRSNGLPLRWKHILVPVDFSECSRSALRYAVTLAQRSGAAVTLLHVKETSPFERGVPEFRQEIGDKAQATLTSLARAEVPDGIASNCLVRRGRPVAEIVIAAVTNAVDVILIGTHGRTGLKHILLGSVAESVVRHAPCPVLVVHNSPHAPGSAPCHCARSTE